MSLSKVLNTDNIIINTMICLSIPIILQYIVSIRSKLSGYIEKIMMKSFNLMASRHIIYRYRVEGPSCYRTKKANRNDLLQRAVMMYISYISSIDKLQFDDADVSFMALEEENESNSYHDYHNPKKIGNSQVEELKRLKLLSLPSENIWANLKNDINLLISDGVDQCNMIKNGDNPLPVQIRRDFYFEAKNPGGSDRIDSFLNEAVDWYINSLNQEEDNNRYLYIVQNQEDIADSKNQMHHNSDKETSTIQYKRYTLSDSKKFSNLFFPEKEALQNLLDNFQNRQGKYSIDGYPHKLGLLLWGAPGTGKTSLMRALAQYLGRNIVSVNLSQIKTNQQLFDIIHNREYSVQNLEFPVKLTFKDVIFVFEDIDACSDIVLSRDKETNNDYEDDPVKDSLSAVAAVVAAVNSKNYDKDKKDQEMLLDKLNLSGLLNVLDGIVDTPNRVIVMTTNHPEKLDSALIRPGRIDKTIYMGLIKAKSAAKMIQHYFALNELEKSHIARLEILLGHSTIKWGTLKDKGTPAYLEQKCCECSTVDELLDSLEGKFVEKQFFERESPLKLDRSFSKHGIFAIDGQLISTTSSQCRRAVSC